MLNKTFRQKSIWTVLIVSLFFTLNLYGQSSLERAKRLKNEGDVLYEKKDYKGAILKYHEAIKANENYPDTYWSLGFALANIHEHKLAGMSLALYAVKANNIAKAYVLYLMGDQFRLAKEFDLSKTAFDSALKESFVDKRDLVAVSRIQSYRGNLYNAVEFQIRAINFNNSDDDSAEYLSLGWLYSFLQEHQKSVDASTKAIQIDSGMSMAYTNRCRAYNDLKLYDKAITDCKKALSLTPNHGETLYYMANSYRLKGNVKEADRLNKLAIPNLYNELEVASKGEDINIHDFCYILGNGLYEDKQFARAVQAYEIGLQFRPNFPMLRFNLGAAYLKVGNKKGANEQYYELLESNPKLARELKKRIDAQN